MKRPFFIFVLLITSAVLVPYISKAQNGVQPTFSETYAYGCDRAVRGYVGNPICGVVIAFGGLKLRESPSFEAKVLALIPFGETVDRTEKGYDLRPRSSKRLMTPDSVYGYWQEITWKEQKGFAFSAYIGNAIYRMTEAGYLLFEREGECWNDCYANPAYHYYGVFTNRDSSSWDIQKINPSFIHNEYGFIGTFINSNTKRTAFMIATKKPLAEGKLLTTGKRTVIFDQRTDQTNSARKTAIPKSGFSIAVTPVKDRGVNIVLIEKSTGRKQMLASGLFCTLIEIAWCGDLDQDGIMDFMLNYTTGHELGCQLFLSSMADRSHLQKPLKIYWFRDCC